MLQEKDAENGNFGVCVEVELCLRVKDSYCMNYVGVRKKNFH